VYDLAKELGDNAAVSRIDAVYDLAKELGDNAAVSRIDAVRLALAHQLITFKAGAAQGLCLQLKLAG
jgi:hypothetical protein